MTDPAQRSLWLSAASDSGSSPDPSASAPSSPGPGENHCNDGLPLICDLPGCGRPVPPRRKRGGLPKRFCSPDCQVRGWNETHPRVDQVLQKPTKGTRCELILGRLQYGSATGLDLLKAGGGTRYGARVKELRERGHRILGPKPYRRKDGSRETETTEPTDDGHVTYRLAK